MNKVLDHLAGAEQTTYDYKAFPLGTKMVAQDGREWRFAEMGGTAGVVGKLYQSEVPTSTWDDINPSEAISAGAEELKITNNATNAIGVDDFVDGYAVIQDDAGEGYVYPLDSHDAIGTSANGTLPLVPGYSVQVAMTTSTTMLLVKNAYKDIIVHPSPNTAMIVGSTCSAIPADEWGWVQTRGPAAVLTDGTVVIGQHVRASDAVDGAVEPLDRDGTAEDEQAIGVVMEVAADTEYSLIFLQLD